MDIRTSDKIDSEAVLQTYAGASCFSSTKQGGLC